MKLTQPVQFLAANFVNTGSQNCRTFPTVDYEFCSRPPPCARWRAGEWSLAECRPKEASPPPPVTGRCHQQYPANNSSSSSSDRPGVQTRDVDCPSPAWGRCHPGQRPMDVKPCPEGGGGCFTWWAGEWGRCSRSCGRGRKKRCVSGFPTHSKGLFSNIARRLFGRRVACRHLESFEEADTEEFCLDAGPRPEEVSDCVLGACGDEDGDSSCRDALPAGTCSRFASAACARSKHFRESACCITCRKLRL